jgi:hypothetical protein
MLDHQINLKIPILTFLLSDVLENIEPFWSVGVLGYWSVEDLSITPVSQW